MNSGRIYRKIPVKSPVALEGTSWAYCKGGLGRISRRCRGKCDGELEMKEAVISNGDHNVNNDNDNDGKQEL
jgi:hypothetical protein